MSIQDTLNERQHTHGSFAANAHCAQTLKGIIHEYAGDLTEVQLEALENICQKISRILVGNPNHSDNWHDIAGYATLAEKECANT